MIRWMFRKYRFANQFDVFQMSTDIMYHIDIQKQITKQSTNDPEALKFLLTHQIENLIDIREREDHA